VSDTAADQPEQADQGIVAPKCAQCGTVLTPAMSYCPDCGAAAATRRNPVLDLAREMTSYESRIWRTVGALLTRPGQLTAEWVQGRRAGYTSPAKLFVGVTMVAFLVLSAIGSVESRYAPNAERVAPLATGAERPKLELEISTGPIVLRNIEFYSADIESLGINGFLHARGVNAGTIKHFVYSRMIRKYQSNDWAAAQSNYQRNMSLLIYFLLPAFPLFMMLLLPRRPYEQHFVFCLHVASFFFIAACIAAFASIWLGAETMDVAILATLVYIVIAVHRIYKLKWWRAIPTGLFLGWLALSLSTAFAVISAVLVVSL